MIAAHQIPSTGRRSTFQVRQMGYASLQEFADSLPKNAIVFDVGAGLSKLGHETTSLRNDVSWINLDPYYDRSSNKNVTLGVSFLKEDIVNPGSRLKKYQKTADLVYSYWMLPHLSLENDSTAKSAIKNMHSLLKPSGRLVIGPTKQVGAGLFSPFRYKGTVVYQNKKLPEGEINKIVAATKLWWLPRRIQLFSNKHNIHIAKLFVGGKVNS